MARQSKVKLGLDCIIPNAMDNLPLTGLEVISQSSLPALRSVIFFLFNYHPCLKNQIVQI